MRFSRLACLLLLFILTGSVSADEKLPNLLIITVDDMSCDSVGAFGCQLPGTTPSIDRLAERGMRFDFAHVQVGNCYPSRNVMFSGRYPHNTGVEGFYAVKEPSYPHLVDLMKAGGYFVAIRGKVSHSTPYQPYAWDADLTILDGKKQDMKNADSYFASTKRGIELAQAEGRPFCLNVNVSDPHKPFYGVTGRGKPFEDPNLPSRIFRADEVPVPGFLFDHPQVRTELAHYYSSVRRADDCVAATLKALNESGLRDNTVILFLSDHGMPLPFAKTAMWHHSTRTPWIVCWPGVTRTGSVDRTHMISAVDMMPTLLDIAGIKHPTGFDGQSFLPLLKGKSQSGREYVYKVYNENAGGNRSPMRCVQSKKYGYHFNPWSDGKRIFRTATTGTQTYRTMQKLAAENPAIAKRLDHFQHNALEEFYDYENDPDALNNLIDDPEYAAEIERFRSKMVEFMKESDDPLLTVFHHRSDQVALDQFMQKTQAEADARRSKRRQNQKAASANQLPSSRQIFLLRKKDVSLQKAAVTVSISYEVPGSFGEQDFHVTLKDKSGKRIQRIVKKAKGKGKLDVEFKLDRELDAVIVSVFVGKDYNGNLLHRTVGPIKAM